MYSCCVTACNSHKRHNNDSSVTYHRFPLDVQLRHTWIVNMTRDEGHHFQVTPNKRVCSKHFTLDCFLKTLTGMVKLKRGSVPTIFSWNQKKTQSSEILSCSQPAEVTYMDHDYTVRDSTVGERLEDALKEIPGFTLDNDKLRSQRFLLRHFQCDPKMIQFHTGFQDYDTLKAVFLALHPTEERMVQWSRARMLKIQSDKTTREVGFGEQLPLIDQFFMFLCHVRQGLSEQDLAVRFSVSQSTVSRNCITWANYLYVMLGSLPTWPSRTTVDELMPKYFTTIFPKTRVLVDCAEFRVQTASSKFFKSHTCSHHKGTTTFKSLIGMAPSGSVSFVSSLYTGSISDQEITKQSGVLDLLEEGDEVMIAKSILIQDLPADRNGTLAMPPFLDPSGQPGKESSARKQELADLRLHVQHCVSRLKEYRMFDAVIPLTLAGSVNQMWTVCALLTNFCGPLV